MKQYLEMLAEIKKRGKTRKDRTGIGTRGIFGYQMRFNLQKGFPLLTTKKVFLKGIIHELLWFLSGSTNIEYLVKNGINIWNEWPFQTYLQKTGQAKKYPIYSPTWQKKLTLFAEKIKNDPTFAQKWGELGPVYGKQWTAWEGKDGKTINQIAEAIRQIKENPFDRRIIVSSWNVGDIKNLVRGTITAPPPCHLLFQFYVSADKKLSCQLYQRSADAFLGVPFNIASYALLTMMIAQVCNLKPGEFIHTFGDLHIYRNHFRQVAEQLKRKPRPLPQMKINKKVKDIFQFQYTDFKLVGYHPHPPIQAPIAI